MTARWNVYESFEALLQAGPYHLGLEIFFIACIIYLIRAKKKGASKKLKLSKKEEQELLDEWEPEPLVPYIPSEDHPYLKPREIDGKIRKYVSINGKELLNLASHSYLNLEERSDVQEAVVKTLEEYGVGSCGPRGFYGTSEVHLQLEQKIAHFYGCESSVLYSYGFATMASAIPAYSKIGDIIYVDDCANFSIQRGLQASRSTIRYFRHNDMEHLEELLTAQALLAKKNPRKAAATRQFVVVEAIYLNSGHICRLPELVRLRKQFRLRLFVDESLSFGTLGPHARGITDHFDIPRDEVDLIMASLEYAGATTGGFTVGTSFVVEHQRLSGLGYCFSASLPPLLAAAAIKALEILDNEGGDLVEQLHEKCKMFHRSFSQLSSKMELGGDLISPVKHLRFAGELTHRDLEETLLREIVAEAEKEHLALVVASYLTEREEHVARPSIRLTVCKDLTEEEISTAADKLKKIVDAVLQDVEL